MPAGWRIEDQDLLQRLEDEAVVEALFDALVPSEPPPAVAEPAPRDRSLLAGRLHPRAAGLVAELRRLPEGAAVVAAFMAEGDLAPLSRVIGGLAEETHPRVDVERQHERFVRTLTEGSPELLHHLALFHAEVAIALEQSDPDAAATFWSHSLAAWLALSEERTYLAHLSEAVLGDAARKGRAAEVLPPERAPLELVGEMARRAEASARELGPAGRAALLALARTDEAARVAGAPPEMARRVGAEAERRRNAAIEAALAVIDEGLDEANARGELGSSGRALLLRAVPVWSWTSRDVAVEQFIVDRVDEIGWELYRARAWDELRLLLAPFRPMFDSLAERIERDPSQLAYAAVCAQMFVFQAEVAPYIPQRRELAERAVEICPTHRNGRHILASVLCEEAIEATRGMVLFAKRHEVGHVRWMIERAEALSPHASELPEAKRMLERVERGRLV